MKTYAYVTTETCRGRAAVEPGSLIGRDEILVSRHDDYTTWYYGKRETLGIISGTHEHYRNARAGRDAYLRGSALAVAKLKGWV